MKRNNENSKPMFAIYLRLSKPERLEDGTRNCMSKMVMSNIVSREYYDKVMLYIDKGQNVHPTEATKGGAAIYARVANNSDGALKKQKAKLLHEASLIGDMNCQVYEEVASGISDKKQTEENCTDYYLIYTQVKLNEFTLCVLIELQEIICSHKRFLKRCAMQMLN